MPVSNGNMPIIQTGRQMPIVNKAQSNDQNKPQSSGRFCKYKSK